jgi:hypothetical protein
LGRRQSKQRDRRGSGGGAQTQRPSRRRVEPERSRERGGSDPPARRSPEREEDGKRCKASEWREEGHQ